MIKVVAKFTAKENEAEKIIGIFAKIIPIVKNEEGNILYQLYQDVENTNIITMIEEWESKKLLDAHLQAPHLQNGLEEVKKLVENIEMNIYTLLI